MWFKLKEQDYIVAPKCSEETGSPRYTMYQYDTLKDLLQQEFGMCEECSWQTQEQADSEYKDIEKWVSKGYEMWTSEDFERFTLEEPRSEDGYALTCYLTCMIEEISDEDYQKVLDKKDAAKQKKKLEDKAKSDINWDVIFDDLLLNIEGLTNADIILYLKDNYKSPTKLKK